MLLCDFETLPVAFDAPLLDDEATAEDFERAYSATAVGKILWDGRDKRLTDPLKLRLDLVDQWKRTALDPWLCRPLCLGMANDGGPVDVVFSDAQTLDPTPILDACQRRQDGKWASHSDFDRDVLRVAALRTNHPLLSRIPGGPKDPWSKDWVDTTKGFGDRPRLAKIAMLLGLQKLDHGSNVLERYLAGDLEHIAKYCAQDVVIVQRYLTALGVVAPTTSDTSDLFLILARRVGLARAVALILDEPTPPTREEVAAARTKT